MLLLLLGWPDVVLVGIRPLLSCRPRLDAALAAVEACLRAAGGHNGLAVKGEVDANAHVHDGAVIVVHAATPISAFEAYAAIAEPIGDAAIEADMRAPIAIMPYVDAIVAPAPIPGRPKQTR